MPNGDILTTHAKGACAGQRCCIHRPSDHPLNTAPLNWRSDTKVMERICAHGVGHPDPDHLHYVESTWGPDMAWGQGVHGCDGCCHEASQEML